MMNVQACKANGFCLAFISQLSIFAQIVPWTKFLFTILVSIHSWALAVSCIMCHGGELRGFMQWQMLYSVAPLQLFVVGNIRNSTPTCLLAWGSGSWINKGMIRWPVQAYQEDAETAPLRLIWSPEPPVITAHICQWVGNEYQAWIIDHHWYF